MNIERSFMQAQGQLANLQAKLAELRNGSRPEEIAKARADVNRSEGGPGEYTSNT